MNTDYKKTTAIKSLENMTRKTVEQNTTEETRFQHNARDMETKYKKELESLQVNIDTLDHWLTEKNTFQAKKEKLKEEIASLTEQLKSDKKEGMIRINEAEFEKIKDVKKLTEEMDFKVKETQANLMALNDEQL